MVHALRTSSQLLTQTVKTAAPKVTTKADKPAAAAPADGFERVAGRGAAKEPGSGEAPKGDPALAADVKAEQARANARGKRPEAAAADVYAARGEKPYDLSDPKARAELVRSSPQLDKLDSTTNDRARCGGAALANALILDGAGAKNAQAIRATAKDLGQPLDGAQGRALDAMAAGKMTPSQAAELQSLLFDLGGKTKGPAARGDAEGLTTAGVGDLVSRVRAHGGLPNTRRAEFRMSEGGAGEAHWAVQHTDKAGKTTFADSWPDAKGEATVAPGPSTRGARLVGKEKVPNPEWRGEVALDAQKDGSTSYAVRFPGPAANYVELRADKVPAGTALPPERYGRTIQRDLFGDGVQIELQGTPWNPK